MQAERALEEAEAERARGEAALRIQNSGRRRVAAQEVEKRRAEAKRLHEELLEQEVRPTHNAKSCMLPTIAAPALSIHSRHSSL